MRAPDCGLVSPAHMTSQVELLQLTEQAPLQVTWQVALPLHEMLPSVRVTVQVESSQLKLALSPALIVQVEATQLRLALSPAVIVQLLPPRQLPLHEPAHVPVQVLLSRQSNVQLPPVASHPVASLPTHSHVPPASHVQVEPVQAQASPGQAAPPATRSSPQARPKRIEMERARISLAGPGVLVRYEIYP